MPDEAIYRALVAAQGDETPSVLLFKAHLAEAGFEVVSRPLPAAGLSEAEEASLIVAGEFLLSWPKWPYKVAERTNSHVLEAAVEKLRLARLASAPNREENDGG